MGRCQNVYDNTYKRHICAHAALEEFFDLRGYVPENDPYFDSEQYYFDVYCPVKNEVTDIV